MAALGVISRSVPSFSGGAGSDAYCHPHNVAAVAAASSSSSSSFIGIGVGVGVGLRRVCRKTRKFVGVSRSEFRQNDHFDYYSSGGKITCGSKKEKPTKNKEKEDKARNQMMKMLEGLSRDLSMFSSHPDPDNAFFDQVRVKMVAEAAELLQGQLEQLMTEDQKLKVRRKAEKIRLKMQTMPDCELSSSSSSESSDSDCGEMVDMNAQNVLKPVTACDSLALPHRLVEERVETNAQALIPEALSVFQSTATEERNSTPGECVEFQSSGSPDQGCCAANGNFCRDYVDSLSFTDTKDLVAGVSPKKIEVCMGGKCKKSGAAALLGEFQRLVGIEGAVSGCKCMGKCRDGPNVRILNDPVKTATNPLCIGVGLEDVDLIVANFIRGSSELGIATS